MITEFIDYVDSFYGTNDPLYPMMSQETKQPLNKMDIERATQNYLVMCQDETNKFCTWGDGDSLDRERVRDIEMDARDVMEQIHMAESRHMQMGALVSYQLQYPDMTIRDFFTMASEEIREQEEELGYYE